MDIHKAILYIHTWVCKHTYMYTCTHARTVHLLAYQNNIRMCFYMKFCHCASREFTLTVKNLHEYFTISVYVSALYYTTLQIAKSFHVYTGNARYILWVYICYTNNNEYALKIYTNVHKFTLNLYLQQYINLTVFQISLSNLYRNIWQYSYLCIAIYKLRISSLYQEKVSNRN